MNDELSHLAISELLSDDYYGLWELQWRLATSEIEPSERLASLVRTLVSMIESGEVVLHSVDRFPDGVATALPVDTALQVVRDVANFEAPQMGSPTFEASLAIGS